MMKRTRDMLQAEVSTQNEDLSQLAAQLVGSRQTVRQAQMSYGTANNAFDSWWRAFRTTALQNGAVAFLGKPFTDEALLHAIQSALQQE